MRVLTAVGRLCLQNWKRLVPYALLYGPLFFIVFRTGSQRGELLNWWGMPATMVIFGIFLGILAQVNESRGKKNQSLKKIDRDVRGLSERELHIAFSFLGTLLGILAAVFTAVPLYGYPVFVAIFILAYVLRKEIVP